jgi:nucleoside-diphosphate-sugar epimerase
MKVLFTGANGFLGKNVIPLLQKKNFEVKTFGTSNADYIFNITNTIILLKKSLILFFMLQVKLILFLKLRKKKVYFTK